MLSPVMLILIGLARVNCDMVPPGDDSNYTLGHSDRLVRLDGAICAHPVSPQAQPLQSVSDSCLASSREGIVLGLPTVRRWDPTSSDSPELSKTTVMI